MGAKGTEMTHPEYMALREQILEIIWQRDKFLESKVDEIMTLVGITYEPPEEQEKKERPNESNDA